jgi:hypothetical protein
MPLTASQLKQICKLIKRRHHPRRVLSPKKVKGAARPKYYRSPLPVAAKRLDTDIPACLDIMRHLGCSFTMAKKVWLARMAQNS